MIQSLALIAFAVLASGLAVGISYLFNRSQWPARLAWRPLTRDEYDLVETLYRLPDATRRNTP